MVEKVAVTNIGKLVSGDFDKGILDADTILIKNGKIAKIGKKKEISLSGVGKTIDANGMVVTPGLIDPHVHNQVGDVDFIHASFGWMENALYAGVTTMISQGEVCMPGTEGLDPIGIKSLAIYSSQVYKHYKPGGFLKVHGGGLMLLKGLTEKDFKEMAEVGVQFIAEIGGFGASKPKDVIPMIKWARKYGFRIPLHYGAEFVPGSRTITADEILEMDPDVVVHLNGGCTAGPWEDTKKLIDKSKFFLEVIYNGNPKMAYKIVEHLKGKNQLNRLILGSDSPIGIANIPLAMWRGIVQTSSMNEIPAHKAIAFATGNTSKAYRLENVGKIEEGRDADMVLIDRPIGSVGKDALESIELGDTPGIAMTIVDGVVVSLKGRDTPPVERFPKINGIEMHIKDLDDSLFGPKVPIVRYP